MSNYRIFVVLFSAAVLAGTWALLTRTEFGKKLRAVIQNRNISECYGIRAEKVYALTFAYGAGLAGAAGALTRRWALRPRWAPIWWSMLSRRHHRRGRVHRRNRGRLGRGGRGDGVLLAPDERHAGPDRGAGRHHPVHPAAPYGFSRSPSGAEEASMNRTNRYDFAGYLVFAAVILLGVPRGAGL